MVEVTARIFAGFATEDGGLDLVYTVTPTSLVNGFAAGFLIGFLTVALTSIRISRINIIAAIRDLPPEAGRPLKRRWVLASTLAAAGFGAAAVVAVAGSQGVGTYLYPALAVVALCPLLVRLLPRRAVYTGASLAVLGWGLAANTVRPKVFDDGSTATFIVLGVVLTFSAVLLVSQNQELLLRLLRPLPGPPVGVRPGGQAGRRLPGGQALPHRGDAHHVRAGRVHPGPDLGAGQRDRLGRRPGGGPGVRRLRAAGRLQPVGAGRRPGQAADRRPVRRPGGRGRAPGGRRGPRCSACPAPPRRSRPRPSGSPRPWPTTACSRSTPGWTASAATTGPSGGRCWPTRGYVVLDQYLGQDGAASGAITYRPGDTLTVVDPGTGRQERKVIAGILADSTAFDGLGTGDGGSAARW